MVLPGYVGIRFPERAESLRDEMFRGYQIFLEYWDALSRELGEAYHALELRGASHAVLVYGPQGSGKTLFFDELQRGFEATKTEHFTHNKVLPTSTNLWHRMVGSETFGAELSADLIVQATQRCEIVKHSRHTEWVAELRRQRSADALPNRLVLLDNAETTYFTQALAQVDSRHFTEGPNLDALYRMAAENFVRYCRLEMRRCLFFIFTNNQDFALKFETAVNEQHAGLLRIHDLPQPTPTQKEDIIRINTNRLNRISYWHCLDRAGQESKKSVYEALLSVNTTFPSTFDAVNNAIRSAGNLRAGRPANKNTLILAVFGAGKYPPKGLATFVDGVEQFETTWLVVWKAASNWATRCLGPEHETAAAMLSSEWELRIVFFGCQFLEQLLLDSPESDCRCRDLLNLCFTIHGQGTGMEKKGSWAKSIEAMTSKWPQAEKNLDSFWNAGQYRSTQYEPALRRLFPSYNTAHPTRGSFRPDLILQPFAPCSILSAESSEPEHLNSAIKRNAIIVEFTAQKTPTVDSLRQYLGTKLSNYIELTAGW